MVPIEQVKVDVPEPAGLAGEVLPADGVHDDEHTAGLLRAGDVAQVGVVGHGVLVLAGEEGAVVPAQGELDHAAVFQHVVVDDPGHGLPVRPGQGADGPCGQDVVDVVDALEGQGDLRLPVQGERPRREVQGRDGEIRVMAAVAAAAAAVVADVLIVVAAVVHGSAAEGTAGPVVVHAPVVFGADGALLQAEPLHPSVVPGKAGHQGVVGVEDQGGIRMDGGEDGVIDPLRVAVAGELVPVEVGDDEVGGVEPLEGKAGIALVALQQQHVPPHPAGERAAAQDEGGHALNLVGALLVVHHGLAACAEDGGNHLHGGGLSVAAGDGDDAAGQLHPAQHIRADFQGVLAGQAAALAHQLADEAEELADDNSQDHSHWGNSPSVFCYHSFS